MPSSCCVPGCSSNYGSSNSGTVFKFPADTVRREKWLKAIHRSNFTPSKASVVCVHHFEDRFIVREDSVKRPDGTVLTVQRERVKLANDAIPTIFKNQPSYFTKTLPPIRKDPSTRQEEITKRKEEKELQTQSSDTINSVEDIKKTYSNCKERITNKSVHFHSEIDSCTFFLMSVRMIVSVLKLVPL